MDDHDVVLLVKNPYQVRGPAVDVVLPIRGIYERFHGSGFQFPDILDFDVGLRIVFARWGCGGGGAGRGRIRTSGELEELQDVVTDHDYFLKFLKFLVTDH